MGNTVNFGKATTDTLQYDNGTPKWFIWSGNYWAVKFSPASPCNVIGGIVGTYQCANQSSKLFVWDDASGSVGTKMKEINFTTSNYSGWALDGVSIPSPYTDANDFWLGFYIECIASTKGILADTINDYFKAMYSADGSSWSAYMDAGDVMIRAIVNYDGIRDTSKTLTVKNVGGANLDVSNISSGESWIVSISPTSFSLVPGASQAVTVVVNPAGLTTGTYTGTISIASNDASKATYSEPVKFNVETVGIEEKVDAITTAGINVSPNPFSKYTNISYFIPVDTKVCLELYDAAGRMIAPILNEEAKSGSNEIKLDIGDLQPGVYFVKFTTDYYKETKKITILK